MGYLEKYQKIRVRSLPASWLNHTAELVVDALFGVDGGKNSAIKKELHHNLFAITTKQAKNLCPCTLFQNLDILIRKVRRNAWNTSVLSMLHGHAFEAMRQQMLGLFGVAMVTIEDFPDHKVNHLRQGSAI